MSDISLEEHLSIVEKGRPLRELIRHHTTLTGHSLNEVVLMYKKSDFSGYKKALTALFAEQQPEKKDHILHCNMKIIDKTDLEYLVIKDQESKYDTWKNIYS